MVLKYLVLIVSVLAVTSSTAVKGGMCDQIKRIYNDPRIVYGLSLPYYTLTAYSYGFTFLLTVLQLNWAIAIPAGIGTCLGIWLVILIIKHRGDAPHQPKESGSWRQWVYAALSLAEKMSGIRFFTETAIFVICRFVGPAKIPTLNLYGRPANWRRIAIRSARLRSAFVAIVVYVVSVAITLQLVLGESVAIRYLGPAAVIYFVVGALIGYRDAGSYLADVARRQFMQRWLPHNPKRVPKTPVRYYSMGVRYSDITKWYHRTHVDGPGCRACRDLAQERELPIEFPHISLCECAEDRSITCYTHILDTQDQKGLVVAVCAGCNVQSTYSSQKRYMVSRGRPDPGTALLKTVSKVGLDRAYGPGGVPLGTTAYSNPGTGRAGIIVPPWCGVPERCTWQWLVQHTSQGWPQAVPSWGDLAEIAA